MKHVIWITGLDQGSPFWIPVEINHNGESIVVDSKFLGNTVGHATIDHLEMLSLVSLENLAIDFCIHILGLQRKQLKLYRKEIRVDEDQKSNTRSN